MVGLVPTTHALRVGGQQQRRYTFLVHDPCSWVVGTSPTMTVIEEGIESSTWARHSTAACSRRARAGLSSRATPTKPEAPPMCRNIKTLFNFDPPATEEEIRAA